jgi:DNA-binding NtrC family response regulator
MSSLDLFQKGAPATLLVVEDEPLTRFATADYFRGGGWRVLEAKSGESAKALFVADEPIEVMFSDVHMASREDGIALAVWVRANYPDVAILLTSGAAQLTDIPSALCAQASTFVKPYDCEMVADRISVLRAGALQQPGSGKPFALP